MSWIWQVTFGSAFLIFQALIHVAIIARGVPLIVDMAQRTTGWRVTRRAGLLLCLCVGTVLVAHTIEIWLWAAAFRIGGVFDSFETSFYFATTTYTTLGYGDLILTENWRIFASFAAITGLLNFGISTAFLVGFLTKNAVFGTDHDKPD